jgi:hypothetical protein
MDPEHVMADSYVDEQKAIAGRLDAQWPHTPIAWPNTHFDPAKDVDPLVSLGYIELRVNRQEAFNAAGTATDKLVRHPGLVTLNVRTPAGNGDGDALDLADKAAAIFRNVTFSGLTFRAPTVRPVGAEGGWYLVQVDCPFHRDSIMAHN